MLSADTTEESSWEDELRLLLELLCALIKCDAEPVQPPTQQSAWRIQGVNTGSLGYLYFTRLYTGNPRPFTIVADSDSDAQSVEARIVDIRVAYALKGLDPADNELQHAFQTVYDAKSLLAGDPGRLTSVTHADFQTTLDSMESDLWAALSHP